MATSRTKPTIQVPPRASVGFLYANGSGPGFSPGPMTLVSTFFPVQSPFSFSQLLAGAMASPLAAKPGFLPGYDCGKDGSSYVDGKPSDGDFGQKPPPPQSPLFMVPPGLSPSGLLSPLPSPFGMSHQQALAHVTAQAAFSNSFMQMQSEFQYSSSTGAIANHSSSAKTDAVTQQRNPSPLDVENTKTESAEVSQSGKCAAAYVAGDKPANDGYNWRKYGQKHVKARECPRSYYKCTYLNCPVKKKVEPSLDGRVSEITYKGQHIHDPPKPTKREKGSLVLDNSVSAIKDQTRTERLNEARNVSPESQNLLTTSQPSFDPYAVTNGKDDEKETIIVVDDGDVDEPTAKRRCRSLDIDQSAPAVSNQAVGISKIVLQTRSEVDLLDDGYKWRKYGQKVVKGNPHPRSYYRCTYAGCNVRKHVERASADPKSVITTYEGKHSHDIPIGKHSVSHGANPQQLNTQKVVSENLPEIGYGNKEQLPTTLQLKE